MAGNIFVISDTHFGHANIIKYCNRPFADIDEMDEMMIQKWNSVVKPGDKVYHLGDVYMGDSGRFLKKFARLNGKKRLIVGNHDDLKKKLGDTDLRLGDLFEKVSLWRIFTEFGLMMTHVPLHESSLVRGKKNDGSPYDECVNVHGHIHTNPSPEGPYRCVCVEQIDYTPISIERLRIR
jgi:calcineurin-like phosphoesterase family protein